jgi:hypothetical protein
MKIEEFLHQYWPNFAGTVSGGIALSTLYFWLKEWLFSLPQISGMWEAKLTTVKTDHRPFEGLQLWYRICLIQNGAEFTGVGELDREDSSQKILVHQKSGRRLVEIHGMIEKRYTKPDLIHVMWSENGERRKFSNVHILNVSGSKTSGGLWGKYSSTAASSTGCSEWSRF